ncbi:MAG: hypothetical protein K9L32_02665, partial [Chromatiaceae bacterium]|nr:hypothetical protein [Chromatiaceae bacterium]
QRAVRRLSEQQTQPHPETALALHQGPAQQPPNAATDVAKALTPAVQARTVTSDGGDHRKRPRCSVGAMTKAAQPSPNCSTRAAPLSQQWY